jgi:hypothetical protein
LVEWIHAKLFVWLQMRPSRRIHPTGIGAEGLAVIRLAFHEAAVVVEFAVCMKAQSTTPFSLSLPTTQT